MEKWLFRLLFCIARLTDASCQKHFPPTINLLLSLFRQSISSVNLICSSHQASIWQHWKIWNPYVSHMCNVSQFIDVANPFDNICVMPFIFVNIILRLWWFYKKKKKKRIKTGICITPYITAAHLFYPIVLSPVCYPLWCDQLAWWKQGKRTRVTKFSECSYQLYLTIFKHIWNIFNYHVMIKN